MKGRTVPAVCSERAAREGQTGGSAGHSGRAQRARNQCLSGHPHLPVSIHGSRPGGVSCAAPGAISLSRWGHENCYRITQLRIPAPEHFGDAADDPFPIRPLLPCYLDESAIRQGWKVRRIRITTCPHNPGESPDMWKSGYAGQVMPRAAATVCAKRGKNEAILAIGVLRNDHAYAVTTCRFPVKCSLPAQAVQAACQSVGTRQPRLLQARLSIFRTSGARSSCLR